MMILILILYGNNLKINIGNTKYMIFKQKYTLFDNLIGNINGSPIEQSKVSSKKYLGLIVKENLNGSRHIAKYMKK